VKKVPSNLETNQQKKRDGEVGKHKLNGSTEYEIEKGKQSR